MKRFVSLVLALMLCAGLAAPALAAEFTDVSADHAFHDAIADCSEKGIVGGYDDGTFRPTNAVTKNHFCAMLARAFYPDLIERYNTDQYKNAYGTFGPTNMALVHNSILRDTSFTWQFSKPAIMDTGINRYDMAQLMTNIMSQKGFDTNESDKDAAAKIADYADIPDQYRDAVTNVYALGIIGGFSDGTFGGGVTMNRGQAAVVIYRLAQYVGDGSGTGPETSIDDDLTNAPENPAGPGSSETVPETPADRTLSNGKAITEENVTEILDQLKAKYPTPTDFSKGYAGLGSGRNANNNCIRQVTNQYRVTGKGTNVSTTTGCGGWAAFIADEIFSQTNVTWKKTTMANIRPGDLIVDLDNNNHASHISICVGPAAGYPTTKKVMVTDASSGKNGYMAGWTGRWASDGTDSTYHHEDVYTAYPD